MASLYLITFENGKSYVGVATLFKKRVREHTGLARRGEGYALHKAIAKNNFNFATQELAKGDFEEMLALERFAIKFLNCKVPFGYNLTDGGDGTVGVEFSKERRRAISERMKGNSHTLGLKVQSPRCGWSHTEDAKSKISIGNIGRVASEFTKERMSVSARKRFENPEQRALISKRMKENHPSPKGSVNAKKISEAHKGKVWCNDGERSKFCKPEAVPSGWKFGRLLRRSDTYDLRHAAQ